MENINKEYKPRIIDEKINKYLTLFGAISIEGPKWCGKTWTSKEHSKTLHYLDVENTYNQALVDENLILNSEEKPILIDEWNKIPSIWDSVRHKCDETTEKGQYILTCSTKLTDEENKKIFHSGAGRICKLNMYPMSLYEMGYSSGKVSLSDLKNGKFESFKAKETSINGIIDYILMGGWPGNLNNKDNDITIIPRMYIESILDKDIYDDKNRSKNKMRLILNSLSRNECTITSNQTILKDISDKNVNGEAVENIKTLDDYLDVLDRLHLINNQKSYSLNYRSKDRVGKSPKRHLVDPSLACACLNLNSEKLMNDMNLTGILFESLVYRDLFIYMDSINGNVYHLRDNVTGLEVDEVLEFNDGSYAIAEVKLGAKSVEEAIKSLNKVESNMEVKPKFKCVIVGVIDYCAYDKNSNTYIIPITSLKP